MALDFTVVINVRQRFGDTEADDVGLEMEAPFVGAQKDYSFRCPQVDPAESALLVYQSQGVNVRQAMTINGPEIFGGIPPSIDFGAIPSSGTFPGQAFVRAMWVGNIMLVHQGVLREENTLRIQAGSSGNGNLDNFIIDNLVVLFKTRRQGPVIGLGEVVRP